MGLDSATVTELNREGTRFLYTSKAQILYVLL